MPSLRILLLILAGLGSTLVGQTSDVNSWHSLRRLAPGRPIEVVDRKGSAIKGTLVDVLDDSIAVAVRQRTVAVARSEVAVVRVHSGRRRRPALIGMALGAGAGVGVGAAAGESLTNTSGGDFANLKGPIIAVSGAAGALAGAVIGWLASDRATTVYRAQ